MAGESTDIVGTVGVDVIPVVTQFHEKLKAKILPGARSTGDELGRIIADAMTARIAAAIPRAVADGTKAARAEAVRSGSKTGGAFADSLRAKLEAAFRAMPKLDVKLSDTGVDAQLARLRAKLEDLRTKRIGIDITTEDARAKIDVIDERLARLGASSANPRVRVDTATARAALAEIRAEIDEASRSPLDIRVRVGQFRENLLAQVEAAQATLPVIEIRADTTSAQLQLDEYRADLAAIPQRLRTDASFGDAEAVAEIKRLRSGLDDLSRRRTATIDVRADAARAEAELATVRAEVAALNDRSINLDFGSANAGALELAINLAILTAIPLAPILGAGVGAVAAALTSAGAAAGAFGLAAIPAIKGVTAAMAAQTAATNSTTKATSAQANAGNTAAQRALQMASAQQGLASAQRQAAQSIISANEQVKNAEQAVADATTQAADQRKQAIAGVVQAERNLADAQQSEKDAQQSLTDARAAAAKQLLDLNTQLADADLSRRGAELAVERAKLNLTVAQKNPKTTPLDLADAQLAYDQAVQAQKEQLQSQKDLTASAAQQKKAGVDGNAAVMQAAEQLAKAQQDVADKTKAVADAQATVAKVAKASARTIADAEQREADAVRNAANTRVNAADSIASAERSIEQAQLSSSKVTVQATTKADAYRAALAKLTPAQRQLFDALAGPHGLKSAFDGWSKSLQPDVLPLFTRGVNSAKSALPGLTPLVLAFAAGAGTVYDKVSRQLKTPFWQGFKKDIDKSAKPAVIGLGVAFGNVFKGLSGIIDAFLPHMAGIAATMDRITGRFAKWGSGLKGSPDFENFLSYVKREGPSVAKFLGDILRSATDVAEALSPVSDDMMQVLGPVLRGIGWLATNMPEVVKAFYGLYLMTKLVALGMKLLEIPLGIYNTIVALAGLETWSWAAAIEATGIPELIGLIIAVVALLALGIYELYTRVGWFRAIVDTSWKAIKVSTLFLWNDVLKPSFAGIKIGIEAVGTAAVWLWKNAIGPSFRFIWEAGKLLATILAVVVFLPIYLGTKALGAVFEWLWKKAIKPSFDGIGTAAVWVWTHALKPSFNFIGNAAVWLYKTMIKPNFDLIVSVLHALGTAASWLWTHAIKPTFEFIGDKASWLWRKALKPQFDLIKTGIGAVKTAFDTAKDGINIAWSALREIAKKPVAFIVDHVYNEGIRPVWNSVAKITGVKQLDKVDTSKWATGGVLPGFTPGRDPHKFYSPTGGRLELSGGESIMRPEWTAAVGAGFVNLMNRIAATRGVRGVKGALSGAYAGGGILGGLGDWAGSAAKFALNPFGTAASLASNPTGAIDALAKAVKSMVSDLGTTDWANMLKKFPTAIVDGLKSKAGNALKDLTIGDGGKSPLAGVRQWSPVVMRALAFLNQSPSLLGLTLARMNQESGGNPRAVNLWDSNAKAGHPSVGLMQLIAGTWREYAGDMINQGPFMYGVSVDPFSNIYASMRYALSRYGSLQAAYGRAGGYDEGGWLMPGDHSVYNHTGKPEPVFTSDQWSTLRANIRGGGGTPNVSLNARVFVGDREITDIVRTEIDVQANDEARQLNTGRRL